jgi:hypothetical protein
MSDDDTTSAPVDAAQTTPAAEPAPAPASPSPSANDAPSQAQDTSGETHQSLLEAVQAAVPELRKTDQVDVDGQGVPPAPTAETDPAVAPEVDDDGSLPEEITKEELAKYSNSAKRRLNKLEKQRDAARAEVSKLKALEPHAQAADTVSTYLRDNDISRDDFLMGLQAMGHLRSGNIAGFRAIIEPFWRMAEQFLGNELPPDMQQAVRQGQLTTEAAVHFTRERMQRQLLENQHARTQQLAQQQQQYYQQQQEHQRKAALGQAIASHVNAWERAVQQHDPEYAAKRNAVQSTMWAVVQERGIPQSPEHGLAIARESYRRVNEQYRSWTPPKRPTSKTPSSTGRSTGAAPEAKNLHEVFQQVRAARA